MMQALENGSMIRGYSTGGTRVFDIRIIRDGIIRGYCRHAYLREALSYAGADYLAGDAPFDVFYGQPMPCHLTGSSISLPSAEYFALLEMLMIDMGFSFEVSMNDDKMILFQLNDNETTEVGMGEIWGEAVIDALRKIKPSEFWCQALIEAFRRI